MNVEKIGPLKSITMDQNNFFLTIVARRNLVFWSSVDSDHKVLAFKTWHSGPKLKFLQFFQKEFPGAVLILALKIGHIGPKLKNL